MNNEIFPCLWFDGQAKAAADFYCSVFKNSRILDESPMVVTFELNEHKFMSINDNNQFKFNDSISFVVNCQTQEEIDYYWEKLTDGGEESMCGWLKDKFGVSWQIVPSNIVEPMSDLSRAEPIMKPVFNMRKLDIETLNNA
jgi:predicted 3-demethylubiquinone-9 3-methyltransferase (glyoxalase superfamily)